MKRMKNTVLSILLIGLMVLVSGCGKEFDAKGLVESFMALMTKGETEQYCKLTGESQAEAEADYAAMFEGAKEAFGDAPVSEEVQDAFVNAYADLLSAAKYEVHEATKDGDTYTVSMDIYPIKGVYTGVEEAVDEILADIDLDSSEQELFDAVFTAMTKVMLANKDNLSYGDPQTVDLKIVKKGNYYDIEDAEAMGEKVGELLIDQSELG